MSAVQSTLPEYLQFWGKARPVDGAAHPWHPLVYHSLDVAAMVHAWTRAWPAASERFAQAYGLSADEWLRLATFLAAAHDLGKLHPCFVAKEPALFARLFSGTPLPHAPGHSHEATGLATLLRYALGRWFPAQDPDVEEMLEPLCNAACGRHGLPREPESVLAPSLEARAFTWLDDVAELLGAQPWRQGPAPGPQALSPQPDAAHVTHEWAGVVTLCDWVGSNQEFFPYSPPELTLGQYGERAQRQAALAIRELSLGPAARPQSGSFSTLYPKYADHPTPLQRHADTTPLAAESQLFILEDETGAGKTEAAMTLALRALEHNPGLLAHPAPHGRRAERHAAVRRAPAAPVRRRRGLDGIGARKLGLHPGRRGRTNAVDAGDHGAGAVARQRDRRAGTTPRSPL